MGRYLVEAHVLGGCSVRELAAAHGVHRSWIYKLIARYRQGGYEALEARSRRSRSCKHATPEEIVQAIVRLREQLRSEGHDAGAHTIAHHLAQEFDGGVPSVPTVWQVLRRHGLVVPQPQKRQSSSLICFQADLPNEMWQTDITHSQLAEETHAGIMNMIDEHSRLLLASRAFATLKARDVVDVFHQAADLHGLPASLLSDNGAVFTATPLKGKVLLQSELQRLGIASKNSRPYHPQTCGKVERLHQTVKRYLARQKPAETLTELQTQPDTFAHYYNTRRPHRALNSQPHYRPTACVSRPDQPAERSQQPLPCRSRQGRPNRQSHVTPQQPTPPHRHRQSPQEPPIKLLIANRNIRIIDPQTGELIRELTLNPNRDYQPLNQP